MAKQTRTVNLKLTPDLFDRLEVVANALNRSKQELIESYIANGLPADESRAKAALEKMLGELGKHASQ